MRQRSLYSQPKEPFVFPWLSFLGLVLVVGILSGIVQGMLHTGF